MKLGTRKTYGVIGASSVLMLLMLSATAFAYGGTSAGGHHVLANGNDNGQAGENEENDNSNTTTATHTSTSQTHASSSASRGEANDDNDKDSGANSHQGGMNGTSDANEEEANETLGANQEGNHGTSELMFALNSAGAKSSGAGEATVEIQGVLMDVEAQIEDASPTTQYTLTMSVNGTTHTLGSLMTDDEGEGEIQAQFNATKAGTYVIGVSILQGGAVAFTGNPSSRTVTLTQTAVGGNQNQNQQGDNVNEVQGNNENGLQISNAQNNKTIPAVVQVTGSGAVALVMDPRFSISVGQLEGNGLAIQISAKNVTGSRVILVNLSSSVDLTSHSLVVTLDGNKISQASSVAQVLGATPSDPSRYIVVGTSTGTQLLVSIPHFSLHIVKILPSALPLSFFAANGTYLLATVLALSVAFAAAYASRKRIFSILA